MFEKNLMGMYERWTVQKTIAELQELQGEPPKTFLTGGESVFSYVQLRNFSETTLLFFL